MNPRHPRCERGVHAGLNYQPTVGFSERISRTRFRGFGQVENLVVRAESVNPVTEKERVVACISFE